MIFFNWFQVRMVLICLIVLAVAVIFIWNIRGKRLLYKIPVTVLGVPTGLASFGLILLFGLSSVDGCNTHSSPLYSPNGRAAIRIENTDLGATGGDTAVVLYASHGFRKKTIFYGGWKIVQSGDVRWIDDANILLRYDAWQGHSDGASCESTSEVHVECVAKPKP